MSEEIKPYVPAEKNLAELTFQSVGLGIVLSVIMCAANVYVGLMAGMTVSAAIPASVISMGVLRGLMKRGTILENNIVHTIASSGESLAAGIIFTVPALVMAGVWTDFNFWETTLIAMSGGVMGVVMMIPLRKAMIVDQKELRYPEGVACAEVLKAGDRGGADMRGIFAALGIGALFKIMVDVVGLFSTSVQGAARVSKTAVYGGCGISPMLMAVGFIVGWEIALLVFMGGLISYFFAIPVLAWNVDFSDSATLDVVNGIRGGQVRFLGIGAMVVAGLFSIVKVGGSIKAGLQAAIRGIRGQDDQSSAPRTEQGITGRSLGSLMLLSLVLSSIVYYIMTDSIGTTIFTTVVMFVLCFFFVAVASYIVGLVGSSNSPVSGMTICAVLVTAGLLLILGYTGEEAFVATLGVAGVVCCAACTSGDICQDLKIGHILGATPRRLQIGEIIGTMLPAFVIAPVMSLLHQGYGIGVQVREGVTPLEAPQGRLFQSLVGGIFGEGDPVPWDMVGWGALVGVACIVIDQFYMLPRKSKFRLYPMPLAVGMYLPLTVTFPILVGGIAVVLVKRASNRRGDDEGRGKTVIHGGLLFASGLVAGEAIMGILIALLYVADLQMPFLGEGWITLGGGMPMALVSIAGLAGVTWMMMRKALGSGDTENAR